MADKDKVEKVLEDYEDVFADIYNTLVFGKEYLKTEQLRDGATESVYKSRAEKHNSYYRDVIKNYYESTLLLASYGIENQSTVEKFMPVRIMRYDSAVYQKQVNKYKKLSPMMTIVLNFSEKRWTKPKSLHELMDLPEELKPLVQDYQIQVFDIAYLEDEVIEQFRSDFKMVAKFFKQRRLKQTGRLLDDIAQPITHLEAVMDLLAVFTKDKRYIETYYDVLKDCEERGEEIDMCKVIDTYIELGREEGREEGRTEGRMSAILEVIRNLMDSMNITAEQAMDVMKLDMEERLKYMEHVS